MFRFTGFVLSGILALTTITACRSAQPQASSSAPTAQQADPAGGFTGTVAETMNSGGYTYARLQAQGKEDVWIAAPEFATKAGERLTVALEMPMPNFESKTMNRTFPLVYFVSAVSRDGKVVAGEAAPAGDPAAKQAPMAAHGSAPPAAPITVEPIAPAPGGLSIAQIWEQRKALAGKEVTVRGKVVKVNNGILGTNWIHVQDGSGSAEKRTNDLTITTDADLKAGDVVTLVGVLAVGKDIGSGYAYDVIVERARVLK